MRSPGEQCAREILETAPLLVQFIRDQIRGRRAAGLSLPQFRALSFFGRLKDSSLSAAAEHLGLSLPATSRLVNGLVIKRFVERRTVSTNRRQIALALTARGRTALENARSAIRLELMDAMKLLSDAEEETVLQGMKLLRGIFAGSRAIVQTPLADGKRQSRPIYENTH